MEAQARQNREQERLMTHQARFVQMGEMLSMIAHQWRQPLNAVSIAAINLRMCDELGGMTSAQITQTAEFIEEQTQKMSQTINDFMEFFKPTKERECFQAKKVFDQVAAIIGTQLKNRTIDYRVEMTEAGKTAEICGQKNELEHVLLNLIGNARDALEECGRDDKRIVVTLNRAGEWIVFEVSDTGGGIKQACFDRIFDPYFTTKTQGKGSGIGLYIARTIIERNYGGSITAANGPDGAVFTVKIPVKEAG